MPLHCDSCSPVKHNNQFIKLNFVIPLGKHKGKINDNGFEWQKMEESYSPG